MSYCKYVNALQNEQMNVHQIYHNTQYGFPIQNDDELFGRLILEINQAGLNWTTILNKQENFQKAYDNFSINLISNYTESDFERLINDKGIIRNRLKINATIYNAQIIVELIKKFGSFKNWLDSQKFIELKGWTKLFKDTFKFTGGEIVNEFLMSTNYLPGAHDIDCPIYNVIENLNDSI